MCGAGVVGIESVGGEREMRSERHSGLLPFCVSLVKENEVRKTVPE